MGCVGFYDFLLLFHKTQDGLNGRERGDARPSAQCGLKLWDSSGFERRRTNGCGITMETSMKEVAEVKTEMSIM